MVLSGDRFTLSHEGIHPAAQPIAKPEKISDDICGKCKERFSKKIKHFCICCDACETWFHGDCVGVAENSAETANEWFAFYDWAQMS